MESLAGLSGILWEEPTALPFALITLVLGGGAAWMTGRAVATAWSDPRLLLLYGFLLSCAVRFLHYGLAGGSLVAPWYHAVDLAVLLAIAGLSFRVRRVRQMTTQYFWLYRRTSPLSYAATGADDAG